MQRYNPYLPHNPKRGPQSQGSGNLMLLLALAILVGTLLAANFKRRYLVVPSAQSHRHAKYLAKEGKRVLKRAPLMVDGTKKAAPRILPPRYMQKRYIVPETSHYVQRRYVVPETSSSELSQRDRGKSSFED